MTHSSARRSSEGARAGAAGTRVFPLARLAGACGLAAVLFTGCGGGHSVRLFLDRPASFELPVHVAVYYLEKEGALDDVDGAKLVKDFDKLKGRDGVLDAVLRPCYPGEPDTIPLIDYDEKKLSAILLAANYNKPKDCARYKLPVKKGENVELRITVDEECLKVSSKD